MQTQTLTSQIPVPEQQPFKELAIELKAKYPSSDVYRVTLAEAFENIVGIQESLSLPEVGKRLDTEIFEQLTLGALPE